MAISKFMKWLLAINVFVWVNQSILSDLEPVPSGWLWVWFGITIIAKAYVASIIINMIMTQPTRIT